ncbi:hypothetical protein GGF37_003285, partial [Kickxella alabastrina]
MSGMFSVSSLLNSSRNEKVHPVAPLKPVLANSTASSTSNNDMQSAQEVVDTAYSKTNAAADITPSHQSTIVSSNNVSRILSGNSSIETVAYSAKKTVLSATQPPPLPPPQPPIPQHHQQHQYISQPQIREPQGLPISGFHSQPHAHSQNIYQQQLPHHYHPNQAPRVDNRYWPYPQQPLMQLQSSIPPGPNYTNSPFYMHMNPHSLPPPPNPILSSVGAGSSSTHGASTIPWRRERRSKACLRCHTKKIKCEGEGFTCDGCKQAGCECKWVEMKKRGPKPKPKDKNRGKANNAAAARTNSGSARTETDATSINLHNHSLHYPPTNNTSAKSADVPLVTLTPAPAATVIIAASHSNSTQNTVSDPSSTIPSVLPSLAPTIARKQSARSETVGVGTETVMQRFFSDEVPADTREAIVSFFDYFYGRIPIFHPATFVRRIVNGDVDPLLIDAIKAYTARIVMQKTGRNIDIEMLNTSVRRRLLTGLDRPTIDYVRAVVLASALSGGQSKFTSYNSLACLASSLVTRLGWHTLDLDLRDEDQTWEEWISQELKRRTFWAVYQLDSYQSMMADRPMTIDPSRIYISTPGSDYTWDDVTVPQILHWPTRHQPNISKDIIIRTGALSYTFVELCNVMSIVCQMNEFLWKVKLTISDRLRGSTRSCDIQFLEMPRLPPLVSAHGQSVTNLFQYPEFARLHDALLTWRDSMVPAEDFKSTACTEMTDFSQFGSTENRRFTMRVRYFCLRCYHTAIFLLLHFANRPSFFDPRSGIKAKSPASTHSSLAASPTPGAIDFSEEDNVLRSLMTAAFSEMLNDGYLAYDVVDESWDYCLKEIFELAEHLERNIDIPIDRCDASISFCLFTSITVLIRH